METRVSIEIGNQTVVAALGYVSDAGDVKVVDVDMTPTEGYSFGTIIDKTALMQCIYEVVTKVCKDVSLKSGVIQFVVPAECVSCVERTITLKSVKSLDQRTLQSAAAQCKKELSLSDNLEIIDMIPSKLSVGGVEKESIKVVANVSQLELTWKVFYMESAVANEWMEIFDLFKAASVAFIPYERACGEAFKALSHSKELSIVDLGADSERVLHYKGGMLKLAERLRLGADTIDKDITIAYKLSPDDAKRLKMSHGEAMLCTCKMDYVSLPDGINECKTKELMLVIQSRLEELYEGVIYQLQQAGYGNGKVVLVGGGNNLKNSDLLFKMLSGMEVVRTKYICNAKSESPLMVKEFAAAIGVLGCDAQNDEPVKSSWRFW